MAFRSPRIPTDGKDAGFPDAILLGRQQLRIELKEKLQKMQRVQEAAAGMRLGSTEKKDTGERRIGRRPGRAEGIRQGET